MNVDLPVIGGALAFLGGAAVSALNFWINLRTLKANPSALAYMSVVRQLLNVAYLVAVFFLARVLPWGYTAPLVGAAVGLTLPAIFLSMRLAKINDSLSARADASSGKGEEKHE